MLLRWRVMLILCTGLALGPPRSGLRKSTPRPRPPPTATLTVPGTGPGVGLEHNRNLPSSAQRLILPAAAVVSRRQLVRGLYAFGAGVNDANVAAVTEGEGDDYGEGPELGLG